MKHWKQRKVHFSHRKKLPLNQHESKKNNIFPITLQYHISKKHKLAFLTKLLVASSTIRNSKYAQKKVSKSCQGVAANKFISNGEQICFMSKAHDQRQWAASRQTLQYLFAKRIERLLHKTNYSYFNRRAKPKEKHF